MIRYKNEWVIPTIDIMNELNNLKKEQMKEKTIKIDKNDSLRIFNEPEQPITLAEIVILAFRFRDDFYRQSSVRKELLELSDEELMHRFFELHGERIFNGLKIL